MDIVIDTAASIAAIVGEPVRGKCSDKRLRASAQDLGIETLEV